MFPNLLAEMARHGISIADLAKEIAVSEKTMRNYMSGSTKITWKQVWKIKSKFFPDCETDYLFENAEIRHIS